MAKRRKKTKSATPPKRAASATVSGRAKPDAEATPAIANAMAQIDGLLRLVPGPITVQTTAPQGGRELHNWDVVGPAMLFSAASCLLSLRWLAATPPPRREQDASILLRRVYEHAVSFAWIAIDPATNAKRWVAYDYRYRLKLDGELRGMGGHGLDPPTRTSFQAYIDANQVMPPLDIRAKEADAHWLPKLTKHAVGHENAERLFSMRNEYTTIYRPTSANTHPTPRSLFAYVNPGGAIGRFSIGFDVRLADEDRFAYTFAPLTFATMLLVAEQVLGYPEAGAVFSAFDDAAGDHGR